MIFELIGTDVRLGMQFFVKLSLVDSSSTDQRGFSVNKEDTSPKLERWLNTSNMLSWEIIYMCSTGYQCNLIMSMTQMLYRYDSVHVINDCFTLIQFHLFSYKLI